MSNIEVLNWANVKVDDDKVKVDGEIYINIDRRSDWGNPYRLLNKDDIVERRRVIQKYKSYVWNRYNEDKEFKSYFDLVFVHNINLRGLVCWCSPKPCHGDVLVKMIEYLRKESE